MAVSPTHNGWRYDPANTRLDFYYRGTRGGHINATGASFTGTLATTGAATLASATTTGNHTFSNTITAGSDGVGTDGEQLTSGGAGAECDWAAAASLRQFKHILGLRTDEDEVLETVANTPVYDFKYRKKSEAAPGERIVNTGDTEKVYTGLMADEAPWAVHHGGRILDPISTIGNLMLAIKALNKKVAMLEAQLT